MNSGELKDLTIQSMQTRCFNFIGLFLILLVQTPLVEADWFEKAKEDVKTLTKNVKDSIQGNENETTNEVSKPGQALAIKSYLYPTEWKKHVMVEPVFGSEIHVVETGVSNKEVVLLIHGLGKFGSKDWLKVIPALESNYHVIAFDLPGFGNSGRPTGRYSPTNYAEVAAWLVDNYIQKQVTVVGHSMGGAVALRYAAKYPEQVNKLVLVDAAGILERTAFLKHVGKIPLDTNTDSIALQKLSTQIIDFGGSVVELSTLTPDPTPLLNRSEKIWNIAFSNNPSGNAALALIVEDFSVAIESLPIKTYIIWGENDPVAPLRTGLLLKGRMQHAELQVIEDAAHVPMNTHPEAFNRLLVSALTDSWPVESNVVDTNSVVGNLVCENEVGETYTGRYQSIDIRNCSGVKLENITAVELRVTDSVIEILNTSISSSEVAVEAKESVLNVTNTTFAGRTALKASGSRLDLAGVTLTGVNRAVKVEASSRFIFSVSDIQSSIYTGNVHGVFTTENAYLDRIIKRNSR
ncbi:alpha/beta fold hydrolase [Microbulbifer sp.]|uniref:alpha/beta fold hydrolase n=1 Tax=Microbulbifer sp. TaxID=1908541 RepID=UPI003F666BCF